MTHTQPRSVNTLLGKMRLALHRGQLSDPSTTPVQPRLRFDQGRVTDPRLWWNGLIYSRYQLLLLPEIESYLAERTFLLRRGQLVSRLPQPQPFLPAVGLRYRRIAAALVCLEARYLPNLDPEWIRLAGLGGEAVAEWEAWRRSFDPVATSERLGYAAEQVYKDAESLLLLAHGRDPLTGTLSQLVRRLPRDTWKHLRGAALVAMDCREGAEILLRFYEDLADHGSATKLPNPEEFGRAWHPLHERLTYRSQPLDQDLMELGLSPHPRVVLVVEGATEELHAPLVWKALGFPDHPELLRLLKLGGVDRDLQVVAALAAAPLVTGKLPGHDVWELLKPPTMLMIAVDPEGTYFKSPEAVARTRRKLISQLEAALRVQGVTTVDPKAIDMLVSVRTWSQRCYEYEHFTDEELADAIEAIHRTCNGLSHDELVAAIAAERARWKDIDAVWSLWTYKPSKVRLAHQLWPLLEAKIAKCQADPKEPVPPIAEVMNDAYLAAQQWRYHSFVIPEAPSAGDEPEGDAGAY